METSELLQLVIAGLKNGSIYALLALGFTIVYAATNVINFAQGEFYMLGGMFAVFAFTRFGLPLVLAVPVAVLVVAGIGVLFERLAIRPRKDAEPMALIIITVGGSLVFASLARHAFGSDALPLPEFTPGPSIPFAGAAIERQALWIWGIVLVTVAGLTFLYGKTRLGRAMRACMQNREAARLMGIDTARVVMISFGLAAALGALAGVAVTPLTSTRFDIGAGIAVKGFAAAILGGLGSPLAAVAGGLLLGLIEQAVIPFSSALKDVVALAVLLAVLFLRPQGLFRRSRREKV
ncbi:MAG: branched-chain amino acid ABC transporter permease [Coriobacteriia bacterium]|nr:branched-chain amino acid ABC transporter permease [Coriobacteriia bacterium]MBN2847711.1 branched-chain amino acid ABC transporter permease [Coriobacteriia bacterium]